MKKLIGTTEREGVTVFEGTTEVLSADAKGIFNNAGLTGASTVTRVNDANATVVADGKTYKVVVKDDLLSVFECPSGTTATGQCRRRKSKSILRTANAREQDFLDDIVPDFENAKMTRAEISKAKKESLQVYREVQGDVLTQAVINTLQKKLPKHLARAFHIDQTVIDAEFQIVQPKHLECKLITSKKGK